MVDYSECGDTELASLSDSMDMPPVWSGVVPSPESADGANIAVRPTCRVSTKPLRAREGKLLAEA